MIMPILSVFFYYYYYLFLSKSKVFLDGNVDLKLNKKLHFFSFCLRSFCMEFVCLYVHNTDYTPSSPVGGDIVPKACLLSA